MGLGPGLGTYRPPFTRREYFILFGLGVLFSVLAFLASRYAGLVLPLAVAEGAILVVMTIYRLRKHPPRRWTTRREPLEGEVYVSREVPVGSVVFLAVLAIALAYVAIPLASTTVSWPAKVLLGLLVALYLVPVYPLARGLPNSWIIVTTTEAYGWRPSPHMPLIPFNRAHLGPFTRWGPFVFPRRYRFLPVMWHWVPDSPALLAALASQPPAAPSPQAPDQSLPPGALKGYANLAWATLAVLVLASLVTWVSAMQTLTPPPPTPPQARADMPGPIAAVNGGLLLLPILILLLLVRGFRALARVRPGLPSALRQGLEDGIAWLGTLGIALAVVLFLLFPLLIIALAFPLPAPMVPPVLALAAMGEEGLMALFLLAIGHVALGPLEGGRRVALRWVIWAAVAALMATGLEAAVRSIGDWETSHGTNVTLGPSAPWIIIPPGILTVALLVLVYLALRRVRRQGNTGPALPLPS